MTSLPSTPSKRPYERPDSNGRRKSQKSSGFYSQDQPLKTSPSISVFRILCPETKVDSLISADGSTMLKICEETGAHVRIEETASGCDEKIIVITSSNNETKVNNEEDKEEDEDKAVNEDNDETKGHDENDENKVEKVASSMKKALLLVFEAMVEEEEPESGVGDEDEDSTKDATVLVRLLVLSNQVGCLLGKGGSVIKQMSAESGAQIRILPRDKLPSCASSSDELVQIMGERDAVRKALQFVSQQLLVNPPKDHDPSSASPSGKPAHSYGHPRSRPEVYPPPNNPFDAADYRSTAPHSIPKFHETVVSGRIKPSDDILSFRLLCQDEKVGGIIGKGGSIVKMLQIETGCEIKILEGVPDSQDRIIVISGPAHPDDRISPAQDGVLRVQARIFRAASDSKDKTLVSRLLVSSGQIGCLLGRGGAIIAEMRKLSGAYIRILGKDQIPSCASENEEVVQINGEFEAVQEALFQITTRLRHHFFRDAFPTHLSSHPPFLDQPPPYPSYMGRREFSPARMYSNMGPTYPKFDASYHLHDDHRPPFMRDFHRPGLPPHLSQRSPSSAPWRPQGGSEGGGSIGFPDYAGFPQRKIPALGGGSQPALITSTTVEVIIPRSLIPVLSGEDDGCLKQIREISDAKITLTDPKAGATETLVIISGTPEQTHAAQSLIQAFVISETEAPSSA